MKFDNFVEIPLPVDEAWKILLDVPRIASCLPGAELTEIESENSFKGNVSVRLGPVALAFTGRAKIEDIDQSTHRVRINAQGLDSKGRGGANAIVNFELKPSAQGSTVLVHTDLMLNGAVAQYGRGAGLIREVATNLINQFAESLKAKLIAEGLLGATEAAAPQVTKPISGMSLFIRVLWGILKRALTGKS